MKLIVITSPEFLPGETELMQAMLEEGLDRAAKGRGRRNRECRPLAVVARRGEDPCGSVACDGVDAGCVRIRRARRGLCNMRRRDHAIGDGLP